MKLFFRGGYLYPLKRNYLEKFTQATQSLQFFGCTVTSAINGIEAIEAAEKLNFDLILMDIQMPEMDGVEATKHIRNVQNNHIPIIALTANAFKKDIDLYLSIGMNDYVTKPFDESVLFNTIANCRKNYKKFLAISRKL